MEYVNKKFNIAALICMIALVVQSTAALSQEQKMSKDEFVNNLVEEIPYGEKLKATWDFMDGEVDVMGIKNLRVDAGNKGLKYKTTRLPMVGYIKDGEITAELGEDSRLTFETENVPFVGRINGLKFHSSVGDDARVSLRYTISLP